MRQRMKIKKTKMKQDLFTYLPPELITEILSRVPAQAILSCKCVCKTWHDLVSTHEFVKLHLSKADPGLALIVEANSVDKIIEHTTDDLQLSTITKLNFAPSISAWIQGSVNGLILLLTWRCRNQSGGNENFELHLCNPITRERIDLFQFHYQLFDTSKLESTIYGFGVSKLSGQYKVIGVFRDQTLGRRSRIHEYKVYTIGTGSWRSITAPHPQLTYYTIESGILVNGSLHWLALHPNDTLCISCFDLETELFTTFSPPHSLHSDLETESYLFAQEDSLCLCDCTPSGNMVIWSMKEYGVDKTWINKFVIETIRDAYPIKISEDGVILMRRPPDNFLFYYSINNKTTRIIYYFDECVRTNIAHPYTPNFLSLNYFRMEKSISF